MLTLPIRKKWFDMIANGEKKEEYRSMTKYYQSRFKNVADDNGRFWCIIQNGYTPKSPRLYCYMELSIGYGIPSWGAEPNTQYYILKIIEKRTSPF